MDGYVDVAVAVVVAYDDRDASGAWSDGDGIVAEACLDGARPDRTHVSFAWVAPTYLGEDAWDLMYLTVYTTGWTLATEDNGAFAVADDDLANVRWCVWAE